MARVFFYVWLAFQAAVFIPNTARTAGVPFVGLNTHALIADRACRGRADFHQDPFSRLKRFRRDSGSLFRRKTALCHATPSIG